MRRGENSAFARHLCIVALIGGWLGSRIWYLAEHWSRFLADPFAELQYTATWRGCSDDCRTVAAGVYFYKLDAKGFSETRRMVLVR